MTPPDDTEVRRLRERVATLREWLAAKEAEAEAGKNMEIRQGDTEHTAFECGRQMAYMACLDYFDKHLVAPHPALPPSEKERG